MPDSSLRFLIGPVTAGFAATYLARLCGEGRCLAFGPDDEWEAIAGRLPDGWRPDLVALWLSYTALPPGLRAAPVPLVGLATDWNLRKCQISHG